jgi:hypothetical protein
LAKVVAWALVAFGLVAYARTMKRWLGEGPWRGRGGRGRKLAGYLVTVAGALTASFGGLMLAMSFFVADLSDDDSAADEASNRTALAVFGLLFVGAGLWAIWMAARSQRRTAGSPDAT